jgi:LSD1 subclass zinc finger protein
MGVLSCVEGGWAGGTEDVSVAEGDEDEEVRDNNSKHGGCGGCRRMLQREAGSMISTIRRTAAVRSLVPCTER